MLFTHQGLVSRIIVNLEVHDAVPGRLKIVELAAEVAANFPPERRVAISSIHRRWHRREKLLGANISKS